MAKAIAVMLVSLILLGMSGCSQTAAGQVMRSDKPRDTSVAISKTDLEILAGGNNTFAFDLYQTLRDSEGNLFYSPYSISSALAMTYAGARGETEKNIAQALSFRLPQERLHPGFNSLDLQLKQRGKGAKGKDGEGFRLNVVNAIWAQKDYRFLDAFLDILAQNYGAGLRVLDFVKETERSRSTINDWVSAQTEQKIKELVPQGAMNPLTRLVLTNAIYFNAAWQYPFNEKATSSSNFHTLDGKIVIGPMMRQTRSFGYAASESYQAVELPYDGAELSMVILLPRPGQFTTFQSSLNALALKEIIASLRSRQVDLTMPKFQYESSLSLKKALTALGMGSAFTENADFSGMDGKRDLLIQDVLHKAFIAADEAGTEAAAATAVIVGVTSLPPEPVEVKIDRPFIFVIRDIPTGSTLFVGRVLDPTAK